MKEWISSHGKALYRAANACLLACMVLFGAGRFLGIDGFRALHLITALAVLGILAWMNDMTVRGRIICLSAILLLLCAGIAAGPAGRWDFWRPFFFWLVGRGPAPREWALAYGLMQTAVVAVVCFLVQVLFERLPMLKAVAAGTLLATLIFCLLARRELSHPGMAFMACFLLLAWEEWVQSHWEKRRVKDNGIHAHTFWIMPFLALYLGLLMIAPAPEKPYGWDWAKAIYRQVRESLRSYTQKIKWEDQEGFCMAFTGFSQEGTLEGNVQEEAEVVMKVRVRPFAEYLYLTGMVYETFDGREWSGGQQGQDGAALLDTAQTLYAVKCYNDKYQRDYLKEIRAEIRYEDFNTGYVFAPLKTWGIEDGSGRNMEEFRVDGALRWDGQRGYGTEYGLRYYSMNTGQPLFDLFLEEAGQWGVSGPEEEMNREIWEEVMAECEYRSGRTFTVRDREEHQREIYEVYLGDVRLSGEVRSFLEETVKDAGSDVEKLRAIENALSRLTYTLVPGKLPKSVGDGGDFLDYFLLESRKGYCTYFATAFVLLARAEGIPARYVQGYCVPIGKQGEAAVYSHMAHAWPEAYLEGVGWIPFEPTPGYGDRRYDPWMPQQTANGMAEESITAGRNPEAAFRADALQEQDEPDGTEDGEKADGRTTALTGYSWQGFGYAALAILAACGGVLVIDNVLGRYRYIKWDSEKKLRAEVLCNLKVLSCFGLVKEDWETLEEFRERIGYLVGEKWGRREIPLRFMEDFEEVLYGGRAVSTDMINRSVEERDRLLELLKQWKRRVWLYCRMRLYLGHYRF